MARCCGGGCACLLQVGDLLQITGVGSAQDPYIIGADIALSVTDNATFDMSLGGAGTSTSPWVLSVAFASTASIDDLPDVDLSAKSNGKVIAWNSTTLKWQAVSPTSASPGAVSTDQTIDGDGSVGAPLGVAVDPARFLGNFAAGVGLDDQGKASLVRRFADAATRAALLTAPIFNQVTMLDTNPGQQEFWNGAAWKPVTNGVTRQFGPELLALSGSYVDGNPVFLVTRQISTTTSAVGQFDTLTVADLASKAGVLTCHFQETGSVPYKAMVFGNIDHISATAYRLDDGTPLASQPITGTVTAYIY